MTAYEEARAKFPKVEPPKMKPPMPKCDELSSDDDEGDEDGGHGGHGSHGLRIESLEWLDFRAKQPNRLHPELWHNTENELNDGPICRYSNDRFDFIFTKILKLFDGQDCNLVISNVKTNPNLDIFAGFAAGIVF